MLSIVYPFRMSYPLRQELEALAQRRGVKPTVLVRQLVENEVNREMGTVTIRPCPVPVGEVCHDPQN